RYLANKRDGDGGSEQDESRSVEDAAAKTVSGGALVVDEDLVAEGVEDEKQINQRRDRPEGMNEADAQGDCDQSGKDELIAAVGAAQPSEIENKSEDDVRPSHGHNHKVEAWPAQQVSAEHEGGGGEYVGKHKRHDQRRRTPFTDCFPDRAGHNTDR